jgi:lipoprotein signal peptidase
VTCVYAGALAATLQAQAAVEYAAKGASGAVSNALDRMHLGVCAVDSALIPCVHKYYPVSFYIAVGVVCLVFWALIPHKHRT